MLVRRTKEFNRLLRAFSSCPGPTNCPSGVPKNFPPQNITQESVDRWKTDEAFQETRKQITLATTIPPEAYYDESYFIAEQQQLFSKEWFCIAHAAEIPKKGDTKVIDVGQQSFIVTRDKKDKINAFYNVCRHRGAKLLEDTHTVNRKRLNCPYHWWSYRLTGELVSTPFFESDNFEKGNYGLLKVRCETWNGLIFINQSKDGQPLKEKFGILSEAFENYPLDEMKILGSKTYEVDIDWKLLAENFMEWYHVAPVHPELAKFSTPDKHLMWEGTGQYVGFMTHPVTNSGGPADTDLFNPTPGSNSFEQQTAFFFHLFPNVAVTCYPHSVYTLVMLPISAGKTKETLYLLQHPESRLLSDSDEQFREKADNLLNFVTKVNEEDIWVCNKVARGLRNSQYRGGRFQPDMEQTCYRFQNMVADSMTSKPANLLYPPKMTDWNAAFPHLIPGYIPPIPQEEVADTLLNIDGMTSEDAMEEQQFSLLEVDPETETVKVLVPELETIVEFDPTKDTLFNPILEVTQEGIKVDISGELAEKTVCGRDIN